MKIDNFFAELKRRNVYKVAVAYAIVGWLLVQVATQVFPFLEIPNWVVRLVIMLVAVGFPIALVIAWAFELTPEGLKRTEDVDVAAQNRGKSHAWIYVVVIGVVFSMGLVFIGRYTARNTATGARTETATGSSIPQKSIAVLPFENLSSDKENAYFTEGVQDEILSHLARIADLKVISRTSVMHYKSDALRNLREISQQLGVAHLLEGSVQRSGNKVRVIAQLIDSRNDAHLWAQTYDRDLADVFAIQSEIAKAIADQLQAKLSPNEKKAIEQPPTTDLAAFDLYSRAKSILLTAAFSATNDPDLRKAVELLDEAVKRDPSFFDAYCQLTRLPGLPWLKLRCKPRHGCDRMLPKHIWPARNIFTSGGATMPALSPNWRLRGERYPMIRVSSILPATFCGGEASWRKVCAIYSGPWSLTRVTLILFNRSRLVTNYWGAIPTRSLRWIAR